MAYRVRVSASAKKELARLPRQVQRRVVRALDRLPDRPRPRGVRKLAGSQDVYRLRVGDYRVVYRIADRALVILVVRIGRRRDVYRRG